MMRWEVLVLSVLVVTAGCFGQVGVEGDDEDGPASAPPEGGAGGSQEQVTTITRELVFEADVPGPQMGGHRLDISWPAEFGVGLTSMELALSWQEAANGFGIETERPDGTVHKTGMPEDPQATSIEGEVTELVPGDYMFHLAAQDGVVLTDTVELVVTATLEIANGTQPAVEDGTVRGPVQVVRMPNGEFRASVTYRANGTAAASMQLTVDTTNGEIEHRGETEQATGTVTAWARGDTRDQARQRLASIDVDLIVREGEIQAIANAPNWTKRGASASTGVPETTTVQGSLDTTNGAITLTDVRADSLLADTTNGAITGSVIGQGELTFDTTNGGIDMEVDPTGDATLTADTTNGAIDLALREASDIGYRLEASTTNGEISESMEEASLQGSDDEATLVTDGYQARSTQVSGMVETTNGNLAFVGR